MAKYSADIAIAVRGGQQLNNTIKALNRLNNSINVVNRNTKVLEGKGFNVASVENYSRAVSKAERAVRKAAEGTNQERQAITALVSAMELENKARERKNILIAREVANQRRVVATANAGVGMQGPALPGYMMRGPSSPIGGGIRGRGGRGGGGGGGGVGSRLGGAVSGAVIGGAFPLLFGQTGGAAAGGAIGGLAGGLLGPSGSFAGSLLGTLIGDIASRGQTIKDLGKDIGFSVQQTNQLAAAFKTANTDVEKFTAVIQNIRGLGLELEDQAKAIQLVTTLTEKYGGSFEKTGNAITSALESGKVTQATLNQLTSQGINIQGELATKYGVSRDAILKMAKDGDISVQTLIDTLVKMGNEGAAAVNKPKTAMERLTTSVNTLGQSLAGLATRLTQAFGPALQWLTDRVTDFVNAVSRAVSRLSDLMSGGRMAQAEIQAARTAETATRDKFGLLGGIRAFNPAAQKFYDTEKQAALRRLVPGAFAAPTAATPLTSFQVPSQAAPKADKTNKSAENEAKRRAEQLKKQLEYAARLAVETDYELQISYALTEQEKIQASYDKERLERMNKYETLYTNSLSLQEREYLLTAQTNEINRANNEYQKSRVELVTTEVAAMYELLGVTDLLSKTTQKRLPSAFGTSVTGDLFTTAFTLDPNNKGTQQLDLYQKQLDELTEKTGMVQQGAEGIGTAFSGAFQTLVTGTQTAQETLAGFFSSVADAFMNMATEIIAKMITMYAFKTLLGLFGGNSGSLFSGQGPFTMPAAGVGGGASMFMPGAVSFRANGGPVTGGSSYIVGERGPELFVPGRSGTIVPNESMGGNSVQVGSINISVENSGDTLSPQAQKQIAGQVRGIVLATLVDQQRGGGILR